MTDESKIFRFAKLPDLIEVTLAPLEISASAEDWRRKPKRESLREELARVMANAPVRSPRWLGEYVERKYAIAALEHKLRIAEPTSGCVPWDWMVIAPTNWYRVQVKHTTSARAHSYILQLTQSRGGYKPGDFDFLAALAPAPDGEEGEAWYIIPAKEVIGKHAITLPKSKSLRPNKMAKWRERWDLFV